MEQSKASTLRWLSELGFDAESVPTTDSQRADLRVRHGDDEYVIEAKGRDVSPEWKALIDEAHQVGVATMSRYIEPWNAISAMLTKAGDQLRATPAGPDAFRLVWVTALHADDDFVLECVERRLCGLATLLVVDPHTHSFDTKFCFYHSENDFRRLRHVDAAILCGQKGLKLYVNSFCPSRVRFRQSALCARFSSAHACCDPEVHEKNGDAYLVGEDFLADGTDRAVWSYIKNKYGALTSKMTEAQFSGVAVLSLERGTS